MSISGSRSPSQRSSNRSSRRQSPNQSINKINSFSSSRSPSPNFGYRLKNPNEIIKEGRLSIRRKRELSTNSDANNKSLDSSHSTLHTKKYDSYTSLNKQTNCSNDSKCENQHLLLEETVKKATKDDDEDSDENWF